jgi:hypothetical protein
MGLPAESNKTPNYGVLSTKADPIEEILAVICTLFRSGRIRNSNDWVQIMEASVGPEVAPHPASVWRRVTAANPRTPEPL